MKKDLGRKKCKFFKLNSLYYKYIKKYDISINIINNNYVYTTYYLIIMKIEIIIFC
jgi:hypothetical protein